MVLVIEQIGLLLRGRPILSITRFTTDRIERQEDKLLFNFGANFQR